ncbi:MAG: DMT family transporter, partial [Thermoplasmatota archaeon]
STARSRRESRASPIAHPRQESGAAWHRGSRGWLAVAMAILAVGTSAIMIRCAQTGPLTIAFYRLLFTTLMLVPWVLAAERDSMRALERRQVGRLAAVGLVLAAHFSLWVTSVKLTTVANSVVLVTTHPLMVAGISTAFLRERPASPALLGGLLASGGVVLMFSGDIGGGGLLGDALALLGAAAAGTYLVAGRSERRTLPTGTYCIVVYGFTTLFLMPLAFFETRLVPAAQADWSLFIAMAAVPGILGHTLYNYALGHVPAFVVSTSLLGEPVMSSLLAALLFAEIPSVWTVLAVPLVFAGVVLASWAPEGRH